MISVIVPIYNAEKVLNYCVDSILNQTFQDFELILVDDGAIDKSGVLCDEYAAKNGKITAVHLENGGVSKARNIGIGLAKGEYICFIDSDDYVTETYLEELIKTKGKYPDCDSVWCGFQTVSDYKGSNLKVNVFSSEDNYSLLNRTEIMTLHEKWLSQMPWNKLFNADIIKNNNIKFHEDLSLGEDLIFNLNYLDCSNGKIAIVNNALNYYISGRKESLDNKYYPNLFEIYKKINSEIFKYIKKWNCDESQMIIYYNSCFYSYEKVLRNTFHPKSEIKNKYKHNKQVMKSEEFREALNNSNCYINSLYEFGYKIASYRFIRILDKVIRFI